MKPIQMLDDYEARLNRIDWPSYDTAYGPATKVPDQLRELVSPDLETAKRASHELWCGLSHQHAYISSAALPSFPFLIYALKQADEMLSIEILEIFRGFAVCTRSDRAKGLLEWQSELRKELLEQADLVASFLDSKEEDARDFASWILEDLGLTKDEQQG